MERDDAGRCGTERVPFDNWDDDCHCGSRVVSEFSEEDVDCGSDLDQHWPSCWDCCCSEDDLFSSARVCDCRESHFGPSVAEGVDSDPDFCEAFSVFWDKPWFFSECVEECRVDVPLCGILWDPEDLCLEFALLLFWIDSFDLGEFHDTFPRREVSEIVNTPLCDS